MIKKSLSVRQNVTQLTDEKLDGGEGRGEKERTGSGWGEWGGGGGGRESLRSLYVSKVD